MNVKAALTRKYGPLPAWGWLLIFGLGVWYYRRKFGAISTGTGTGSVASANPTPGTGEQVLQPGESIYDPTAGALATAPGGGADGGANGGSADLSPFSDAIDALANAIATGMPPEQVNVTGGDTTPALGHKKAPPRLKGKGAIRAPSGHSKPKGPKGYTVKGLGHGFWEFVPKAKPKSKGQGKPGGGNRATPTGSKRRKRSGASVRIGTGGRNSGKHPSRTTQHPNPSHTSSAPAPPSRARQRPRTPATTVTVRQRTATTHPAQKPRQGAAPSPRPSAPAPRTQRAPARPPAKPAARKRK